MFWVNRNCNNYMVHRDHYSDIQYGGKDKNTPPAHTCKPMCVCVQRIKIALWCGLYKGYFTPARDVHHAYFTRLANWWLISIISDRIGHTDYAALLDSLNPQPHTKAVQCNPLKDPTGVNKIHTQIAKFLESTWGPPGSCRPQMGPMLAPLILLSGYVSPPQMNHSDPTGTIGQPNVTSINGSKATWHIIQLQHNSDGFALCLHAFVACGTRLDAKYVQYDKALIILHTSYGIHLGISPYLKWLMVLEANSC